MQQEKDSADRPKIGELCESLENAVYICLMDEERSCFRARNTAHVSIATMPDEANQEDGLLTFGARRPRVLFSITVSLIWAASAFPMPMAAATSLRANTAWASSSLRLLGFLGFRDVAHLSGPCRGCFGSHCSSQNLAILWKNTVGSTTILDYCPQNQ